ncbi:uncharacterized protein [Bemisia tabaci]|uniref:uncharacterized protein n=1 Tax=Bemisia tabaci TaxID=7038 RepID=UPI003B2811DD
MYPTLPKIWFLSVFVLTQIASPATPCNELSDSKLVTFKTNRQVLSLEGETLIPVVIDLVQYINICGVIERNDALAGMFLSVNEKETNVTGATLSRQKRLIPLAIAVGAGIGTAAWMGYKYIMLNDKIDQLRMEASRQGNYLKKAIITTATNQELQFVAIRRELTHLSIAAKQANCESQRNITKIVFRHWVMNEFDALIESLRSEKLTSTIIPLTQLRELIKNTPELTNTVYQKTPYLLYSTGRIAFNMEEVTRDYLRGVLIVPIIPRRQRVELHAIAKNNAEGKLTLFSPIYVTEGNNLSVTSCRRDIDTYFCTDAQLQSPVMHELTADYLYEDGIFVLNTDQTAVIKTHRHGATSEIKGPAICSYLDTPMVIYKNRLLYTQSSAFHIHQETINLNITPYKVTLKYQRNEIGELEGKLVSTKDLMLTHHVTQFLATIVLNALLTIAIIIISFKLRRNAALLRQIRKEENPLSEVLVMKSLDTDITREFVKVR